jgi:hypothetical protein
MATTVDPVMNENDNERLLSDNLYYGEMKMPEQKQSMFVRLSSARRLSLLALWLSQSLFMSLILSANIHSALDIMYCKGTFYTAATVLLYAEMFGVFCSMINTITNVFIKEHSSLNKAVNMTMIMQTFTFAAAKIAFAATGPRDMCPIIPNDTEAWLTASTVASSLLAFQSVVQLAAILKVSDEPTMRETLSQEETIEFIPEKPEKVETEEPSTA